jgi:hypothetical protein
MSRTLLDGDLRVWEVFASASKRGFSEQPRIVFHCMTDRTIRSRFIDTDGDQADAERAVVILPVPDLLRWFQNSREMS